MSESRSTTVEPSMSPRESRPGLWLMWVVVCLSTGLAALTFDVVGLTFNPERVAAMVALPFLGIMAMSRPFRSLPKSFGMLAFGFIAVLALSTMRTAYLGDWFTRLAVFLIPITFYFVGANPTRARWLVAGFRVEKFAILMSVLGIVNVLAAVTVGPSEWYGSQAGSGLIRARGLAFEPNIYGAMMATLAVFLLLGRSKRTGLTRAAIVLAHISLILSLSRGPWIAYAATMLVCVLSSSNVSLRLRRAAQFGLFGLGAGVIGGIALFPQLLSSQTLEARLVTSAAAWEDILRYPFLGAGANSLGYLHPELNAILGISAESRAWTPSLPLAILHDFGIIGLVMLGLWITAVMQRTWHRGPWLNEFTNAKPVALAFLALIVAALFTTTHTTAFFWLVFGLVSGLGASNPRDVPRRRVPRVLMGVAPNSSPASAGNLR